MGILIFRRIAPFCVSFYLVEYPAFSTDEMFYVMKAQCWEENNIPCIYGRGGGAWPEFTNPPALSWSWIIIFRVFGISPFVVRMFILLLGLLNLLVVFLIGKELGGKEDPDKGNFIALVSGLVLALDSELVYYSRIGYLDNPMNFFSTCFLLFYLRYLRTHQTRFAWLAGLAAGIGLWFKLSILFILLGLGIYIFLTWQIEGPLRVQAMIFAFLILYVQWGVDTDPVGFANGTIYQVTKDADADPAFFWEEVILGNNIRSLFLFSVLIPFFYYNNRNNVFAESSILIFSLFLGLMIMFSNTRTLFSYYLAGFASIYAILYAISVYFGITLLYNCLSSEYEKYLKSSLITFPHHNSTRRTIWLGILLVCIVAVLLEPHYAMNNIKSKYPPNYISKENQEYLEIMSFILDRISKHNTIVAPLEIGPWLNASGYHVWNTWLNSSTPDWVVRDYIIQYDPDYLVLHQEYYNIQNGLGYYKIGVFPNYFVLENLDISWRDS
ncbi:MAG: glycosyltransferase family 39 protein [Candidatus Heimdallarchaeota archaeon]